MRHRIQQVAASGGNLRIRGGVGKIRRFELRINSHRKRCDDVLPVGNNALRILLQNRCNGADLIQALAVSPIFQINNRSLHFDIIIFGELKNFDFAGDKAQFLKMAIRLDPGIGIDVLAHSRIAIDKAVNRFRQGDNFVLGKANSAVAQLNPAFENIALAGLSFFNLLDHKPAFAIPLPLNFHPKRIGLAGCHRCPRQTCDDAKGTRSGEAG